MFIDFLKTYLPPSTGKFDISGKELRAIGLYRQNQRRNEGSGGYLVGLAQHRPAHSQNNLLRGPPAIPGFRRTEGFFRQGGATAKEG